MGIGDIADNWRPPLDRGYEIIELIGKGAIGKRKLPGRGFRGAHLRQHAMQGQSLRAIAAAEPVDGQFAVAAHDLESVSFLQSPAPRMQPLHSVFRTIW